MKSSASHMLSVGQSGQGLLNGPLEAIEFCDDVNIGEGDRAMRGVLLTVLVVIGIEEETSDVMFDAIWIVDVTVSSIEEIVGAKVC